MANRKYQKSFINQCIKAMKRNFHGLNIEVFHDVNRSSGGVPDTFCFLRISAGDGVFEFEAKIEPNKNDRVKRTLSSDGRPYILLDEHIEMKSCADLQRRGIAFADLSGNMYLPLNRSLIYVAGQSSRNAAMPAALTSSELSGTLNARLVFGLLARPDFLALTQRELAEKVGIALGGVSRGLKQLTAKNHLSTPQKGQTPTLLRNDALLDYWCSQYEHRLAPKLRRRRMSGDIDALRGLDVAEFGMRWGGEVAAERITGYLRPVRYQLYADPTRANAFAQLAAAAKLRKDDAGNIEIIDRFWSFDPADGDEPDTVPLPLVYADLMASGDPRCHETAKLIKERFLAR
jgi:hypothetical protein